MNLMLHSAIDVERWHRIDSVLDVALELPPHEVGAYLDRACAGSPVLRAEVEELLEADRRAAGFLSVPPALVADAFADDGRTAGAGANPTPDSAAQDAAPPARLGRYGILDELGRGGMGIVYRGFDETLGREVAIKVLPAAVAEDPERLGLFLREAKLLGALHHPNIAGIRGIEQAAGRRYLILEKIDGWTLADRMRAGPLPVAAGLDALAQVASALAAAHAYGIVHRDLKPGNIMITPRGLVKVLDFGLAMHVSDHHAARRGAAAGEGASGSPPAGARRGTPGYMSPEQVLGRPQDERADLFAFGAVLYHALAGERAFRGGSVYAVLDATLHASPDFTRIPEETPAPVRELLARLLEKDPARRPADASEVAAMLARGARGESPVAAARDSRAHGWAGNAGAASSWSPQDSRAEGWPEPATPLIGREREITETLELLERAPIVTLTGTGGCGKSRVALEVARSARGRVARDRAPGGGPASASGTGARPVWYADVSSATDLAAIAAAIAAAARLRDPAETGLPDALAGRLGEHGGLLVLDNVDRVPAECAALAGRLLSAAAGLRILATCRERLGIGGEQTFAIAPLAVPDADTPARRDAVLAFASARLFEACAATLPGGFEITDTNAARVTALCRDLDGVPLAIELTAALLRHQSLEAIVSEVAHAAGGQDPLQGALALGYRRLAADERRFLRALSVFTGGWNLEAAAAVCEVDRDEFVALDFLTRLIDKSLVTVQCADRIEPRYRLLEPIRHFAATQAGLAQESHALRARHLDWFVEQVERTSPALQSGADQARALARLEADHPNLLAALASCEDTADGSRQALRLAGSVWLFWYIRGHFTRGREALARALALPSAPTLAPARAQAMYAAGGLALFQGDYAEGRRLSRAAIELYEQLHDSLGLARSLVHLGLCESGEQRYAEARDHTRRAIEMFRGLGEERRLSVALNNLGVFERQQGDFAAAFPHHEEALALLEQAGDQDGMLVTRVNLALASTRLCREAIAGRHIDAALELVQELKARRSGAAALEVAAEVLANRGLTAEATRLLGTARALRAAIGLAPDAGWRRVLDPLAVRLQAGSGSERFERWIAEGTDRPFEESVREARRCLVRATMLEGGA